MVLIKSLVLAGLATAVAAKSAVLDLIPSNFDDVVLKSGKPTLVEFFAPWCGHCKKLAPVYEELATAFASDNKVQIAKVDADAEKSLGKRFGIQGFPTLKWFDGVSDQPEDYKGGRDLNALREFVASKAGVKVKKPVEKPSEVVMLSDSTFKSTTAGDKNVLVAFTAPWCGHCKSLAPVWEQLAEDFVNEPDVVVAKLDAEAENSKATAKEQKLSGYPTIKFYPKGQAEAVDYNGGRSEADLVTYLNEKAGTHRAPGGSLTATGGTIEVLNQIAIKYAAGQDKLADLAAETKKAAGELGEGAQYKYAEYYIKVFDKLSQNEGHVAKESARLDGIIKRGGLAPVKLDEMQSKSNILKQFLKSAAEKATGGKVEL